MMTCFSLKKDFFLCMMHGIVIYLVVSNLGFVRNDHSSAKGFSFFLFCITMIFCPFLMFIYGKFENLIVDLGLNLLFLLFPCDHIHLDFNDNIYSYHSLCCVFFFIYFRVYAFPFHVTTSNVNLSMIFLRCVFFWCCTCFVFFYIIWWGPLAIFFLHLLQLSHCSFWFETETSASLKVKRSFSFLDGLEVLRTRVRLFYPSFYLILSCSC
jgi:hypothetical protein